MKTSKNLNILTALGLFAAVSGFSYAAAATPSAEKFAHQAAESNLFEIKTSQLALNNSQNADIKAFAQNMIDDHTAAGSKLKSILPNANLKDAVDDNLSSDDQMTVNKLGKLSGSDFDKKYVSAQKSAHKDAVKLFTDYSKNGDNDALKSFAGETLPTLQQHLDHVKQLSSAMK